MRRNVLIADDHPIFRAGLRQLIESGDDFQVIAEASEAEEAFELARAFEPEALVLDCDMPGGGGLSVAKRVRTILPSAVIIFLTMHKVEALFNEAMDLGALGYVLKDCAATEIVEALEVGFSGRTYLSPVVSDFLLQRQRRVNNLNKQAPGLARLSPTERRVLAYISQNRTSKEIGALMRISSRTVDRHRNNISQKLGLSGSHSLLKFAFDHKQEL